MKRSRSRAGSGKPVEYRVQLYSESARLIREFDLDAVRHGLRDMEAAEHYLRQTLTPCDFTSTVCLSSSTSGRRDEEILQFELGPV